MRLRLILPRVEPSVMSLPSVCPYEDCQGRHFRRHQEVDKPLKDTEYDAVSAQRYECLRCKRTFRLYPKGVTRAQTSQRVKGLGVMLYLLGLSYGATSLALEALGVYMSKTSVYEAVQAAAEKVSGLKRDEVFAGLRTPALAACRRDSFPAGQIDDKLLPCLSHSSELIAGRENDGSQVQNG